ncbi:MAG: ribonuclease R [Gammaproteobacteria bacterium]|nr:ribonuclease R [Gammaproteobacteria bacterium]
MKKNKVKNAIKVNININKSKKIKHKKKFNPSAAHDPHYQREAERYEKPIASREHILSTIENSDYPLTFKELSQQLYIFEQDQKKALDNRLSAMIRDGQLNYLDNRYQLLTSQDLILGEVIGHSDGYGFVKVATQKSDLYLPNYEMRRVFPGDLVEVVAQATGYNRKMEAKILNIKEHKIKQLVGKLEEHNKCFLLKPEDTAIKNRIEVILEQSLLNIKDNQIVLAEIVTYPSKEECAKVRIIEIIGDYFAPGVEIEAALRRFEIPHVWPLDVHSEVEQFSSEVSEQDKAGRIDLRHLPLVTIDGEDAKDFDDAVYCELLDKNNPHSGFKLYVAIADVSYYVKADSALDQEAYLRGNSVYFPGRVVPMLPEILSNGLCSLNPNVDRLCFICEAEIDSDGKVTRYRFFPAVMRSQARLTYTKVAEILINNNSELQKQYKSLVPHLQNLYNLFQALLKQRSIRGAIDFDSTETMIEFDNQQKISAIHPVVRNDAHRIIEECMLVANVCAANYCHQHELPILYRNHATPPEDKVFKLQEFLGPLGLALKRIPPKPKDIARLLERTHNRPDTHVIQMVALRSLSQAMYESKNEGHFGLAFDQYAHFTSPIRRYPDLLLHRQLHYFLSKDKHWRKFAATNFINLDKRSQLYFKTFKQNIITMGEHCSRTERRADDATRDVTAWLKCEYMQDKLGMDFKGCISGVTHFGIFVELNDFYVEGLVHVSDLKDDYYNFNEKTHALHGERTGKKYRVGDAIEIKVAKVDLDSRQIDFVLAFNTNTNTNTNTNNSQKNFKKFKRSKKSKLKNKDNSGSKFQSNRSRKSKNKK